MHTTLLSLPELLEKWFTRGKTSRKKSPPLASVLQPCCLLYLKPPLQPSLKSQSGRSWFKAVITRFSMAGQDFATLAVPLPL